MGDFDGEDDGWRLERAKRGAAGMSILELLLKLPLDRVGRVKRFGMRKIQAVLKDIAQKTLLLTCLIDEAMAVGVLTREDAGELGRRICIKEYLIQSLETAICWSAQDGQDSAMEEELQGLVGSAFEFIRWVERMSEWLQFNIYRAL
ncbi:hypothetical protein [Chromobacterium sp. IIBBL 290-4]|uniref:hypothetical protein n=1 Tax=Chromobacterium sp. IIBBL 290-4 TaxID=2953890 RepID=UPI0020B7D2EC|nr:hypothetical protein [Chromobacterium sp. IIBBL 290-4]UTH74128.1 hypothetical protein NKT35_21710 [Chromobacterium sp. IIBBL 290-4]